MKLHPYLILQFEVRAVRKWLLQIHKQNIQNPDKTEEQLFMEFRNIYCKVPYWGFFGTLEQFRPTKTEKILYLYFHCGLGMTKITKVLGASATTVLNETKKERKLRHYEPHPGIDELIKAWEQMKKHMPKEIFIKYI